MARNAKAKSESVDKFARLAREMGAGKAKIIDASSIRCEPWVRLKCQFGCPGYNKRLLCPPYTPTPEEMKRTIACYRRALLMHAGDNDIINEIVPRLEREIFLAGYYKALGLGSGPCYLCTKCDTGRRCKHPYQARPSMESCGIDVFHTARSNGFSIEVVRTKRQRGDYYGVVLID